MGTVFSFDVRDEPVPALREALARAVAWLHRVDAVFSPYRPDSSVGRLARRTTTLAEEPADVAAILELCAELEDATRGCFSARPAGRLDPSGVVKGWATEEAARILERAGARNLCVNGGGDLQLSGEPAPGEPWRVGIADPRRPDRTVAVVSGRDLAVATSGNAERGRHITDPRTGVPVDGPLSCTVVGPHLTRADPYATAALVMGDEAWEWLARLDGYALLTVPADGGPPAAGDGFPLAEPPPA